MANSFQQSKQEALEVVQAIENAVLSLNTTISNLNKTASGFAKNLGGGGQANVKAIKQYKDTVDSLNTSIDKQVEGEEKLKVAFKSAVPTLQKLTKFNKDRQASLDGVNSSVKSHIPTLKQLVALKKAEAETTKKVTQTIFDQATAFQKNKEALQAQKKAALEASRPYVKLVAAQQRSKKVLDDLMVSQGKNSRETKKAQREYDKLTNRINHANSATEKFSKGGLRSAFLGVRNLLGAFGLISGVSMFADLVKDTFALTKTLDSMAFSMKAVIKEEIELAQTTRFLRKTANDYGADLVTVTNRYIKFRAAAQQAGFTAFATQKIFATMTKAAGVLGLKKDELQGIFLALEQMVSKGKITTEELRRQLGERLPGAMDIMATSMGKTTAQLDEMLKKGEVITKEVLEKFAEQVEIAFGLDTVKKVETLQAATSRLQNNWMIFVEDFSKANKTTEMLRKGFDFLADNLQTIISIIAKLVKSFVIYKGIIIATNVVSKAYTATTTAMSIATALFRGGLKAARIEMIALNVATKANPLGILLTVVASGIALFASFRDEINGVAQAQRDWNTQLEEFSQRLEEKNTKIIGDIQERMNKEKELLDSQLKSAKSTQEIADIEEKSRKRVQAIIDEESKQIIDNIKLYKERIEAYKITVRNIETGEETIRISNEKAVDELERLIAAEQDRAIALGQFLQMIRDGAKDKQEFEEGTIGWYKEQIKLNNNLIEKQTDRSVIKTLQDTNKEHQRQIDLLLGVEDALKKVKEQSVVAFGEIESNGTIENTNDAYKALSETFQKAIDLYGEKTVKGRELVKILDLIKETTEDLTDVNKDANDEIERYLELELKRIDAENKRAKSEKERLKQIAEDTENFLDSFATDLFSGAGFDFLGSIATQFKEFKEMLEDAPDDEKWAIWANSLMEITQEMFNFINQQSQARFDAEYDRLEQEKEISILFAGESTTAKEEIERQYEEKRKEIQKRQAEAEKKQAIFNAVIDTAQAVVSMLATGGVAGFAFAAIAGAIGAAQIAMISSTPIPQYWSGTDSAREGFAKVDELRPEVHTDKHGNIKSFGESGANIRFMEKGDKVFSSREKYFEKELGGILSGNDILPYNQMMGIGQAMIVDGGGLKKDDFVREIRGLRTDIKSKENIAINVDKSGVKVNRGNTELLNNKIRLKGRTV